MANGYSVRGAKFVRIVVLTALLLVKPFIAHAQSDYRPELRPYVDFLEHQKTSCKDYILGLFKTHDLVILCERAHGDTTQYDLILSIIRDPRFIDSVGNIFTEVGVSTQAAAVNSFVHQGGLSSDSIDRAVMHFQRNCSFYQLWEHYTYTMFLRGLHALNEKLPAGKKVNLFNSDMPFDWSSTDSATLKKFWDELGRGTDRDSVMAFQVIGKFDEIRKSGTARHKALVIMNYRHAFRHQFTRGDHNAGIFLFERYPGRVANVYINSSALVSARSDNDLTVAPIQDGKWDAAFKVQKVRDAGFDFAGSPFGRDTFDIFPAKVDLTWEKEFDGFAFYLPLEEHATVFGMPGFIDSAFAPEMLRRDSLYNSLGGRWKRTIDIEREKEYYNNKHTISPYTLDSMNVQIRKWLKR